MIKRSALAVAAFALVLSGCSSSGGSTPNTSSNPGVDVTTPAVSPEPTETEPAVHDRFAFPDAAPIEVSSTDFVDGGELAVTYAACAAGDVPAGEINPQLTWGDLPEGTVSVAVVMIDRSASGWGHWLEYNIPVDVHEIAAGDSVNLRGVSGLNNRMNPGYYGPCPPEPGHHYEFMVWALDTTIEREHAPRIESFLELARENVIGFGSITGIY